MWAAKRHADPSRYSVVRNPIWTYSYGVDNMKNLLELFLIDIDKQLWLDLAKWFGYACLFMAVVWIAGAVLS